MKDIKGIDGRQGGATQKEKEKEKEKDSGKMSLEPRRSTIYSASDMATDTHISRVEQVS